MKLSKNDIIKLIYSEYYGEPEYKILSTELMRIEEFEFLAIAENKFHHRVTICRKNTYLIG